MRPHLLSRIILAAALLTGVVASAVAQTGRVGGIVKDGDGQAVKSATITAEFLDANTNTVTAATDEKGRFAMIGLRFGEWTFYALAPGYEGQSTNMHVRTIGINPPMAFTLTKRLVPPSAVGQISPKDLQTALAAADALYDNQRWDDAIAAYRGVLAQAPALTTVHLQIAAAFRNKKDFDGARAAYQALLATDPENDRAKVGIAMADLDTGDLNAAAAMLEGASQSKVATREVFLSLGNVRLAQARPDDAVAAFGRAAELDPGWGKPRLALGRVAMDKGHPDVARTYFRAVVSVDPLSPEAGQAATLLQQMGQ